MAFQSQGDGPDGLRVSPGGFEFGVQGWNWGEPRPRAITFFLDGTAMVTDQHGRPIKGASLDGKEVWFATRPPQNDDPTPGQVKVGTMVRKLASHADVVAALEAEGISWRKLVCAGWPQLPYSVLKEVYGAELQGLPPTPMDELKKIRDSEMRREAFRARMEYDGRIKAEERVIQQEIEEQIKEAAAAQKPSS